MIKRIFVIGVWIALSLGVLIAFEKWNKAEIADYDVKVEHVRLSTSNDYKYCPYCGERLEEVKHEQYQ